MGTLLILRETRQDIIGEGGRGLRWLATPPPQEGSENTCRPFML